jgi:hypothetical protein
MPRTAIANPPDSRLPFTNPWPLLWPALGAAVLAMLLHGIAPQLVGARVAVIVAGTLLALGAVSVRLRTAHEDAEDRFKSAGIIAMSAVVPFLCGLSLDPEWDSAGLLLGVLVAVALAGAGLLMLPRIIRRLTLTFLVLLHFGGILSAVCSPAPPQGPASWLVNQLWTGVYRPYLYFMYLNNAYHFYSPDPGPPMLVWFRIEYEGNKSRWVEVPTLAKSRSKLAFQRRLALTESTNQLKNQPPVDFDKRLERRIDAGRDFRPTPIPLLNDPAFGRNFEYREPVTYSKQLLRSYARYVLSHYPYVDEQGEAHPDVKPLKVKIYRVIHAIPDMSHIANGFYPYDPTTYMPYYQGEFDTQGNLLDGPTFKDGMIVKPGDPFLYWLVPIRRELKKDYVQRRGPDGKPLAPDLNKDYDVVDYLKVHAGDADKPSFWDRPKH